MHRPLGQVYKQMGRSIGSVYCLFLISSFSPVSMLAPVLVVDRVPIMVHPRFKRFNTFKHGFAEEHSRKGSSCEPPKVPNHPNPHESTAKMEQKRDGKERAATGGRPKPRPRAVMGFAPRTLKSLGPCSSLRISPHQSTLSSRRSNGKSTVSNDDQLKQASGITAD